MWSFGVAVAVVIAAIALSFSLKQVPPIVTKCRNILFSVILNRNSYNVHARFHSFPLNTNFACCRVFFSPLFQIFNFHLNCSSLLLQLKEGLLFKKKKKRFAGSFLLWHICCLRIITSMEFTIYKPKHGREKKEIRYKTYIEFCVRPLRFGWSTGKQHLWNKHTICV